VSARQDSRPSFVPGSVLLQELQDRAPSGHLTLQWLLATLHKQSYPGIIFFIALVAVVPGISVPAGLLLLALALQMIARRPIPTFPRWIAQRPWPADRLNASLKRAIPALKMVETAIHPRWPAVLAASRWIVGFVILLLTARLLLWPLPFSNMLPAALIGFIALADLEEDGLMVALALAAGMVVLGVDVKILYDVAHDFITRISTAAPAS
jgi:hypothetical protein